MWSLRFVLLVLAALCSINTASAMVLGRFTADMQAANVVSDPPSTSSASALGTFTLFDTPAGPELEYFITTQGLDLDGFQTADPNDDVTGLHIHLGAIGEVGGLVYGILNPDHDGVPDFMVDPVAGTLQGRWTPDDVFQGADSLNARVGDLLAGNLYIQFHTTEFQSSDLQAAVRGQILNSVPEPGTLLLCMMGFIAAGARLRRRGRRV